MARRPTRLAALVAPALILAAPVAAQAPEACSIVFNGVEVERIDSLNSPLELDTTDVLVFSGTDAAGTRSAVVRLFIGPVPIESGTTTYATPQEDFTATINLDDVSPYGVGLFRAEAETDGCAAGAWVRVSGRFPLATLTGLTAIGLAIGGATGQLGASSSRRRWARSAATLGGLATGTGLTLIGQQFGRLQVSFVSIGLLVAGCGLAGWILASLINPDVRERRSAERDKARDRAPRRSRRGERSEPGPSRPTAEQRPPTTAEVPAAPGPGSAQATPDAKQQSEPESEPDVATTPEPEPEPDVATTPEPEPKPVVVREPPPPTGPYWCYVLAPTDVFDLHDHTRTVALLGPGTWYLAKRTVSGWAHVVAGEGIEGWVAASAIHRQG